MSQKVIHTYYQHELCCWQITTTLRHKTHVKHVCCDLKHIPHWHTFQYSLLHTKVIRQKHTLSPLTITSLRNTQVGRYYFASWAVKLYPCISLNEPEKKGEKKLEKVQGQQYADAKTQHHLVSNRPGILYPNSQVLSEVVGLIFCAYSASIPSILLAQADTPSTAIYIEKGTLSSRDLPPLPHRQPLILQAYIHYLPWLCPVITASTRTRKVAHWTLKKVRHLNSYRQ